MKYEYVETITKSNIKLNGMMINNNNDKCVLYIPGMGASFFDSDFARSLMTYLANNNYDFIFGHNQGSFQIISYKYLREDGKWKNKILGTTFEDYNECINDIDAWIKYAESLGKKEIILIGHSRGCNKIVSYLSRKKAPAVSKIVLLSPQDMSNFNDLEMHIGMYEESKKNVEDGNENKLLEKRFLDFAYVSSKVYLDIVDNIDANNIPYKLIKGDFKQFEKIDKDILVVIGTKDGGENSKKYMEEVCKHSKKCQYALINDANHTYDNKFEELNKVLLDYLEKK